MVENLIVQLETNKFIVLLLKLVGVFYPQLQALSATRVLKNRSTIITRVKNRRSLVDLYSPGGTTILWVERDVKLYTLTHSLTQQNSL